MDKEYIYLLAFLLLSFSIGLGAILMSPNDFQRLEKGWEVPFTMPVYQETGLSKYPIKGYFKRVTKTEQAAYCLPCIDYGVVHLNNIQENFAFFIKLKYYIRIPTF